MADTDNKTTSTKENPNQESTTETVEKTEAPQEPEHIPEFPLLLSFRLGTPTILCIPHSL